MNSDWNYAVWTPWTQPSLPLYLTLTLDPSFSPLRHQVGSPLFTSVIIFKGGDATWVFRADEAGALGQRLLDFLHVPAHRSNFEDELVASIAQLEHLVQTVRQSCMDGSASTKDLLELFASLRDGYYRFYVLGAFVEPVQIAAQARLASSLDHAAAALTPTTDEEKRALVSAAYSLTEESFATGILRRLGEIATALQSTSEDRRRIHQALAPLFGTTDHGSSTSIADAAVATLERESPDVHYLLRRYSEDFSWSRNNYARCIEISPTDVLRDLASYGSTLEDATTVLRRTVEEASTNRRRDTALRDRLLMNLNPHDATTLSIHELVGGRLSDARKRLVMMTNGAVTQLVTRLAERLPLAPQDLLYLLPQEVETACTRPERYRDRLKLRQECLLVYQADFSVLDEQAMVWRDGFTFMADPYIAEGDAAVNETVGRLSQRLNILSDATDAKDEISGVTVFHSPSQPRLVGRVTVVRDPSDKGFADGDVLVATSTTPDFMGVIQRASAIVTDWGGQTSHAAITARELGKPCIIGTNYASSALRTGDWVELNFEAGLVTKVQANIGRQDAAT